MQRTAFGIPVEPEVKISSNRSSAVTSFGRQVDRLRRDEVEVLGAVDVEHAIVGHARVDAVEQAALAARW